MKNIIYRMTFVAAAVVMHVQNLVGQVPTNIPGGKPEPVPVTLANIIVFILIPLGLLVFYIWWLKQNRKKAAEEREKD